MHELQRLRTLHILLVDDDPGACNRIQQALGSGFLFYHKLIRESDRLPSDLAAFPLMED